MTKLPFLVFATLLYMPYTSVAQGYVRPVKNMSIEDLKDERYGIRLHQKQVNYMIRTAEGIRDGACSQFWRGAMRAKQELSEIPSGVRNYSYRHKRAAKEKENKGYLDKYEQCFSRELRSYPKIYNNDLDPARSYNEFEMVYNKLSAQLNKNQARYFELGQELKARGVK